MRHALLSCTQMPHLFSCSHSRRLTAESEHWLDVKCTPVQVSPSLWCGREGKHVARPFRKDETPLLPEWGLRLTPAVAILAQAHKQATTIKRVRNTGLETDAC